MLSPILDNQIAVRLGAMLVIVLLVASWEVLKPRRSLSISKSLRWTNNWLISALNSVLLSLAFPVMAVGVAMLADEKNWGLFNVLEVPAPLSIPLFILAFDFAIGVMIREVGGHIEPHRGPGRFSDDRILERMITFVAAGLRAACGRTPA